MDEVGLELDLGVTVAVVTIFIRDGVSTVFETPAKVRFLQGVRKLNSALKAGCPHCLLNTRGVTA